MPSSTIRKTNPYGANSSLVDPRQKTCWDFYTDRRSPTFSNAFQSAIKADYSRSSAIQITTQKWFVEKVRKLSFLDSAEQALEEILDMPVLTLKWCGVGKEKRQVLTTDASLVRLKQNTAIFIVERFGKYEGYSKASSRRQSIQHELVTSNQELDTLFI